MKFNPLGDKLLVRRSEEEETTAGGIVLPGSAAEKPSQGEVLAIGPGRVLDSGEKVEFHEVLENIIYRDNLDSTRKDSPLVIQKDAVLIDNSFLSIEDQLLKISSLIKEKLNN